MLRFIPIVAASVLCPLFHTALAQSIYKCSVENKVSYGDRPCTGGVSVELVVPPASAAVPTSVVRERAMLLQLEKQRMARAQLDERVQREQARERRALASARLKCDRLRLRRKWAVEDQARASGAQREAARLKARRQGEALAIECPA